MPVISKITGAPFRFWCQKILPAVYDDSLSYYELLCKVVDYLNKVMEDDINVVNLVNELEDFVNNYFDNLDVQQEINNKLDAMTESGELYSIIAPHLDELISEYEETLETDLAEYKATIDADITDFKNTTNSDLTNFKTNINTQVSAQNSNISTFTNSVSETVAEQENDISVLQSQMSNFMSSETPDANAELIDIRVAADGTIYNSAGDAVRGQVTVTNNKLYSLSKFFPVLLKVKNHSYTCLTDGVNKDLLGSVDLVAEHTYYIRITGNYNYGTSSQCTLQLSRKATSQGDNFYTEQASLVHTTPKIGAFDTNTTYTPSISQSYDFGVRFLNAIGNANQAKIENVTLTIFDATGVSITETPVLNHRIDVSDSYVITEPTDCFDYSIIDCFGDSLTAGAGGTPYPSELQTLLGGNYRVNNFGVGGEYTTSILARMGAVPAIVDPVIIGTTSQSTELTVHTTFGYDWLNIRNGRGANPVSIDGVKGNIYTNNDYTKLYFTPLGYTINTHEISRPTIIYSDANNKTPFHILVLFMGQNGGWTGQNAEGMLVEQYESAVKYMRSEKYLFVGITTGTQASRASLEIKMASAFGGHYINARDYLVQYGLSDNGLTPSAEDTAAINEGSVPPSLLSDSVHLNTYGYKALANCIYKRGHDLLFW